MHIVNAKNITHSKSNLKRLQTAFGNKDKTNITSCFSQEYCVFNYQQNVEDFVSSCSECLFALDDNNEFLGCIASGDCPYMFRNILRNDETYIHSLCVDSKHRNGSIGTELMNKISNDRKIALSVLWDPSNEVVMTRYNKLQEFYARFGLHATASSNKLVLFM